MILNNTALLAIFSGIIGAFAGILARKILIRTEYGPMDFIPVNFLFTTVIFLFFFPWFWNFHPGPSSFYWLVPALGFDFLANSVGFRGAAEVKASTYSIIVAFSPLITILLVAVIGKDSLLSFPLIAGSMVIIAGLLLTVLGSKGTDSADWHSPRKLVKPLLAMFFLGIGVYFNKGFLQSGEISSYSYLLIRYSFMALSMALVFRPKKWKQCIVISWKKILLRSGIIVLQFWSLTQALLLGNVVVVSSLANSTPIFVALFSLLMGFERPKKIELVGIAVAALGIMAIIYFR